MTLEILCEKVVEDYNSEQNSRLNAFDQPNSYFAELSLGSRIEYANEAYSTLLDLQSLEIEDCYGNLMEMYKENMYGDFVVYNSKVEELEQWKEAQMRDVINHRQETIKNAEQEMRDREHELYSSMQSIISKHSSIPKDKLEEIIQLYQLPIGTKKLNIEEMSIKDVEDLIDLAHYASTTTVGDRKVTDKILSAFYLPLLDKSRDKETDFLVKVSHFAVLLILMYLLKPYFMAIVGFIYIVHFLSNLYKVKEREELLCSAYEVSEPINFLYFIEKDEVYLTLKERLELLKDDETFLTEESKRIEKEYNERKDALNLENPQIHLDEIQKDYNMKMMDFLQEFEKTTNKIKDRHRSLILMHESHLSNIDKHFDSLKKGMKMLGSYIHEQRTMNMDFRIGSALYKNEIVAEASIPIPLSNINFLYNSDSSKVRLINFCKLLLCNALSNVKEKYLKVTVYDPNDLGKDFSEFLNVKLADYVKVVSADFRKLAEALLAESKANIASLKGADIQTFNSQAEGLGKITKDYHIVIIASNENEIFKDKQFSSFMKYSANFGVWVWNIMKAKTEFGDNKEDRIDYDNFLSETSLCLEPGLLETPTGSLGGFESPLSLYEYRMDIGLKTTETLVKTIEENRVEVLPYEEGYRMKYIPDDKIWTFNTLKGIELRPGLLDGDPDKPMAHILGDNTVHGLMAGATGAGKSATINEMLASLLHMYSPEELELIMVDFKNVEFKMYTEDLLIPHAKIIAGTKDGEYALSIFDYAIDEMMRRTRLFGEVKVQKIEEYNRLVLAENRKDLYLARILMMLDEFQVMFTDVTPRILDKIKDRITSLAKLARFGGLHMFFTSQSMKNTMPADVLEQFKLRLALFLTKETSNDLLGNAAASTIKGKGWLYTNDSGAQSENANRLFRIPFASNKYIKEYIPRLVDKCEREGHLHRRAIFYDEEKLHPQSDLLNVYESNPTLRNNKGLFILGERTMYSLNTLPYNFVMTKDDGEHVIISCFERESLLNLSQTFIENCIQRNVDYCVHSADKESTKLLGLKDRVPDRYKILIEEQFSADDLIDMLEDIINTREEIGVEQDHNEFYFIAINWEKLIGLGRDEEWRLQDKFKRILQRGGAVNVHLIMLMRETVNFKQWNSTINHKIISQCSERESGYLTDTDKGMKLGKHFGIHVYGSDMIKFKLYQFKLQGAVMKREVSIQ